MINNISKKTLIILSTFNDQGVINSKRNDLNTRLKDYQTAFKKWFMQDVINDIIIIENSNYNSLEINNLIKTHSSKKNIKLIQFEGQFFDKSLGKGYGVFLSLKYLIEKTTSFNESNNLVIVPGRYYISNFKKIMLNSKTEIVSDFQNNLSYAFNPVLICSKKFIIDYLIHELKHANDGLGIHYEHCLAKAVHRAIADGLTWNLIFEVPIIQGISGTTNLPYYRNIIHKYTILLYSKIKYYIFKFAR